MTKLVVKTLGALVIGQYVACKSAGELYESRVDKRRTLALARCCRGGDDKVRCDISVTG